MAELVSMGAACPTPQKHRYYSRKEAKAAKKSFSASHDIEGLRAYLCPCGHWHLGHRMRFPASSLPVIECAKRLARDRRGNCPRPGIHKLELGGKEAWLCDDHWLELNATAERLRAEAAA